MAVTFVNTPFPEGQFWSVTRTGNMVTAVRLGRGTVTLNGTIAAAGDSFTMTNANGTFTLTVTLYDSATAFLAHSPIAGELLFSNVPLDYDDEVVLTGDGFGDYQMPCFAAGTRIRTRRGEVAVEALAVGDEVALLRGGFAPVAWLGHREVDCTALRHPAEGWPLRVRAHAFGPGAPHRDLFLSPDHAVHANGVLIPVRHLENGTTIRREMRDAVTYWHVELARHDVLLAEGLGCESYLDTGNRHAFGPRRRTDDAAAARNVWATQACATLEIDGPVVAAVRTALAARATALNLALPTGPAPRLRACGQDHAARRDGEFWHLRLPAPCNDARLVSDSFVPATHDPAQADWRCLGMAVRELVADGHSLPLTHPALRGGWHDPEPALRWTSGAATLPRLRELAVRVAPLGPWAGRA